MGRIAVNGPQQIQQRQASVVNSLLQAGRLARMVEVELMHPSVAYPVGTYLDDVLAGIWGDAAATARDPYRRALQRAHVTRLAALLATAADATDVRALARAQLATLSATANAAAGRTNDRVARAHLQDMRQRIDQTLNPR
jgi:hypothetical protein